MGIEHTAYRQIRSVFGIASISDADFTNTTPEKFNICIYWIEVIWKYNTQHIANMCQYLGLRQFQILTLQTQHLKLKFEVIGLRVYENRTLSMLPN